MRDGFPGDLLDKKTLNIIDQLHDNVVISDKYGVIVWVSPSFVQTYRITYQEIVGKTVYEMEKKRIYYPAIAVKVLETKEKSVVLEFSQVGDQHLVVVGKPIFDENSQLAYVISYSTDFKEFNQIKEQYQQLEDIIDKYSSEIRELRNKDMKIPDIVCESKEMQQVIQYALKVASVDTNLLITGETGVGKNLIAHFIHKNSERSKGPFIEINCGAIPENLLEAELFGYKAGAFTGANDKGKIGMIELADEGTLLLDEVGELPLNLQVKLLKTIQDKSLTRIGETNPLHVNFRLIAATNKSLETMVKAGEFREDLYYRLNVIPIHVPPLRDRREDILPLLLFYLDKANKKYKKSVRISGDALNTLISFDWPGNTRQLCNLVERLVVVSDEASVDMDDLCRFDCMGQISGNLFDNCRSKTLKDAKNQLEREMVIEAYKKCKTTVEVSKYLGISQPSAVRLLKKHVRHYTQR